MQWQQDESSKKQQATTKKIRVENRKFSSVGTVPLTQDSNNVSISVY